MMIVPAHFTKANVDIMRAKAADYEALTALAQQRLDAAVALNDPELDWYIEAQRQDVEAFTVKALGQKAQVDACVAAGVDK